MRRWNILKIWSLGFLFCQAEVFTAADTISTQIQEPTQSNTASEKMTAMVKQQALLNMVKQCQNWQKEKTALTQEIADLKKQVADLQEQLKSGKGAISGGGTQPKKAGDSIEQVRQQLEIFNKAYEYMFYANKFYVNTKKRSRADQLLRAFNQLSTLYAGGSYVQEMNELVRSYARADKKTRAEYMRRLMAIKAELLSDFHMQQKNQQESEKKVKQEEEEESEKKCAKQQEVPEEEQIIMPQQKQQEKVEEEDGDDDE